MRPKIRQTYGVNKKCQINENKKHVPSNRSRAGDLPVIDPLQPDALPTELSRGRYDQGGINMYCMSRIPRAGTLLLTLRQR
jgi:hypothetical protein